jgi:hypothetical protein
VHRQASFEAGTLQGERDGGQSARGERHLLLKKPGLEITEMVKSTFAPEKTSPPPYPGCCLKERYLISARTPPNRARSLPPASYVPLTHTLRLPRLTKGGKSCGELRRLTHRAWTLNPKITSATSQATLGSPFESLPEKSAHLPKNLRHRISVVEAGATAVA